MKWKLQSRQQNTAYNLYVIIPVEMLKVVITWRTKWNVIRMSTIIVLCEIYAGVCGYVRESKWLLRIDQSRGALLTLMLFSFQTLNRNLYWNKIKISNGKTLWLSIWNSNLADLKILFSTKAWTQGSVVSVKLKVTLFSNYRVVDSYKF
jgi:hypothetical protein